MFLVWHENDIIWGSFVFSATICLLPFLIARQLLIFKEQIGMCSSIKECYVDRMAIAFLNRLLHYRIIMS